MKYRMTQSQEVLLRILKAALRDENSDVLEDFDQWGELIKVAKSQSVLPIIAKFILKDTHIQNNLSNEIRLKLKSIVVSSVMTSDKLNKTLVVISDILKEEGIAHVLLKGWGLAQNYPLPSLRQCGDIDLYVGIEYYERSHSVLKAMYGKDVQDDIWEDKHYDLHVNDIQVEIHRVCDEHFSSRYDAILQYYSGMGLTQNLETCAVDGTEVFTPEKTFNAFYIFYHLYRHFMYGGVGLRQLCDWELFLRNHHNDIDTSRLHAMLTEMKLMEAWRDFGKLIVTYLGFCSNDFPFYDSKVSDSRVSAIMNRIIEEGNFGFERSYYKGRSDSYIVNKFMSLGRQMARFIRLMSLYPRASFYYMMDFLSTALRRFCAHR